MARAKSQTPAARKSKAWYAARKEHIAKLAEQLGKTPFQCERCGKKKQRQANAKRGIQYHHRAGEHKLWELSNPKKRTDEELLQELAKCDCLCYRCHREIHWLEAKGVTKNNTGYMVHMVFTNKKTAEEARELLVQFRQEKEG